MYKAVFIDVDGTLIRSDHTVTKATVSTIQSLKENNILVILVSARPLSAILPIIEEIGLPGNPVASLNGAYITANGKILFDSVIDLSTISTVHEQLQQYHDATIIYYQKDQWFSGLRDYWTNYEQKITSIPITIQSFSETLRYWQHQNTGPHKMLVIHEARVINEIQSNLKQNFIRHLHIATSKPTYLEIMNIQASKLQAVKLLIDMYNIKREETIAIGDNFNDKEMLGFAGLGIAMGNAPPEVKAVASYITSSNNKDGVSKALIKFFNL
jgi:Cof subfamily protein (haloacid dehalogenase superfamily)